MTGKAPSAWDCDDYSIGCHGHDAAKQPRESRMADGAEHQDSDEWLRGPFIQEFRKPFKKPLSYEQGIEQSGGRREQKGRHSQEGSEQPGGC